MSHGTRVHTCGIDPAASEHAPRSTRLAYRRAGRLPFAAFICVQMGWFGPHVMFCPQAQACVYMRQMSWFEHKPYLARVRRASSQRTLLFLAPASRSLSIPVTFLSPTVLTQARFSCKKIYKIFRHFPSHRIFRRMHEALNIDKK
jgi:hypothetical protein